MPGTGEPQVGSVVAEMGSPTPSLLTTIREQYESSEEEFLVTLPKGETMRFRRVTKFAQIKAIQKRCKKFVDDLCPTKRGEAPVIPPEWAPYFILDRDLLAQVYAVSETCLEPDFAGNHLNCLILASRMYPIFLCIVQQIDLGNVNMLRSAEGEEVNEEKND